METVSGLLREISRYGRAYRDKALSPLGICSRQGMYIREICGAPGISQEQLARTIRINKSNVARQVAAMEEEGYIERRCCGKDKRIMRLYPTQKALDLLPQVLEVTDRWETSLLKGLTPEEREKLAAMLHRVLESARDFAEEG